MSTQSSGFPSIPLSIAQPFRNIRLLEVPDEVLDIIANSDEALYFKSSPSLDHDDATKEGNLHLCSENKAWLVKQVSTSNSVYVTRTTNTRQNEADSENDEDHTMTEGESESISSPSRGITAVSKPTSILELYPVSTASYKNTVSEYLSHLVPTVSLVTDPSTTSDYSMRDLHDHIPAPTSIIKQVLAQRCVFELPWPVRSFPPSDPCGTESNPMESNPNAKAYMPTSDLLLETWCKIAEAATISDTKITSNLNADMLLEAFPPFDDTAKDTKNDVYKAIANRLFEKDGYFAALGLITKGPSIHEKEMLNELETSRWIGNMILKAHSSANEALEHGVFEKKWENVVPASWVKYCSVEVLGDACVVVKDENNENMVTWRPFAVESGATSSSGVQQGNSKPATAATTSKGKRKWHEKFAAQRNAKR